MRKTLLLLSWAISLVASWPSASYEGSFSNFNASAITASNSVVQGLYSGCQETDVTGTFTSTGSVCVARLISHLLQALEPLANGSIAIATVKNDNNVLTTYGPSLASELASSTASTSTTLSVSTSASTSSTPSRKRDLTDFNHRTLQAFNDRLDTHPIGLGLRATAVVSSDVHPWDGVAVRMNVHSDNSTLHLHTNGEFAMAKFDVVADAGMRRRDSVDTQGHEYLFSGVQGVKMEARRTASDGAHDYAADLVAFAYAFAYEPVSHATEFAEGDEWMYTVCDSVLQEPLVYGKLNTEVDVFDTTYEPVNPLDCTSM